MRAYRRLEVLARGGMGSVERVELRDGRFRRVFARKRLLDAYRDDAEVREMFLDEARLAGLIRHPNVVSVVDVGEDRDGPFLVMELVEGVSLGELAASCSAHGPLPLAAALTLAVQIADGLRAAHELRSPEGEPLGLIHRDLTPGNVLVGFDGLARITDFGIAKAAGQSSQTRTGVLKGKPSYMAPEQLRFRPIDQRADLFAFGCVLYELLAGKRLYPQKGIELPELVRRIVDDPPPDLHDVRAEAPDALVELLFELLAKEPEDRPASAAEVGDRLRSILRDVVDEHGESSLVELLETRFGQRRVELETRRHSVEPDAAGRRSWVAVALGVGALVAVGVGVWLSTRAEEEAAQVAPAPAIVPSVTTAPEASPPEAVPEPTMLEPTMPEAPVEAAIPAPERPATSRRRRPAATSGPEAEGIRRWGWEESP
ncbi:MAG: protein kinase [Polyangiales bacterium]